MQVLYMYPAQNNDRTAESTLVIKPGEALRLLRAGEVRINSFMNTFAMPFSIKKYAEDDIAGIEFNFSRSTQPVLLAPDSSLQVAITDSARFWLTTIFAVL